MARALTQRKFSGKGASAIQVPLKLHWSQFCIIFEPVKCKDSDWRPWQAAFLFFYPLKYSIKRERQYRLSLFSQNREKRN
jgi:hypothetical protein